MIQFRLVCMGILIFCRCTIGVAADVATTQPDYSSKILTPPAPPTPRINGPRVYGQRPGRPFIYTIPATGDRPMTFAADGLPDGLKLDPQTGRISGSVALAGEFNVTLSAKNSAGSDEKKFKIVIGDKISLTPPMGWNSWNCWAWMVDQDKILRSAKAMVSSGLINHGWSYINIDDTWQGKPDPQSLALQSNEKFPDIKSLVDQIHGMGLKAGIYSTPWRGSYAMFQGGSADNAQRNWEMPPPDKRFLEPNPHHVIGQYHFASNDAKQWAAWGMDYLKYDWNPNDIPSTKEMNDALLASGRDFIFSLSNSAPFENAPMLSQLSNCWRTTGDIRDNWFSMSTIGFSQSKWTSFAGPGHWNDTDMLVVGWVGWGEKLHSTYLTADEQYTHISLWSLLSAPMLIGCDLEKLDPFTLNLLTNDEVLAIDQDPLGKQATCVSQQGGDVTISGTPPYGHPESHQLPRGQVWAKELEDGTCAVGLFNLGDEPMTVTANFSDLKLSGKQVVRDLWRQENIGAFADKYEAIVPPHGVVLVKMTPASK